MLNISQLCEAYGKVYGNNHVRVCFPCMFQNKT